MDLPYTTVRSFALTTSPFTSVVTEVSAKKRPDGKTKYRVGTFRVYRRRDGIYTRSPWLGPRELRLKQGLEFTAAEFIARAAQSANEEVARGDDVRL